MDDKEEYSKEELKDLGIKWYVEPPKELKRKGFSTKKEAKEDPKPILPYKQEKEETKKGKTISRTMSKAYLEANWSTVSRMNDKGELEIIPSDVIRVGETFWILEDDNERTEAKIYGP